MSATHGWNKTMQKHAKPHNATAHSKPSHVLQQIATAHNKPSHVLQRRWGKVARCNKEGNEVGIMLANNLPG